MLFNNNELVVSDPDAGCGRGTEPVIKVSDFGAIPPASHYVVGMDKNFSVGDFKLPMFTILWLSSDTLIVFSSLPLLHWDSKRPYIGIPMPVKEERKTR